MGLFNKILVGVDGSASSLHALRQILRFSHGEKIPSIAASVVPPYEGDLRLVGVQDIKAVLRQPCEKALEITNREANKEGLSIQTVCLEGKPHEELLDFALENGCDLIVLGTRGESFEKYLLGSVTARVIGYSLVDVLVIPFGATIGWQNILCPVDGSAGSGKAAHRAIQIAETYGATLKILSATNLPIESYADAQKLMESMVKEAGEYVQEIQTQAAQKGIKALGIVREGDASEAILSLARTDKVELIAIGSHGKSGLKRLLMGSVAERVVGNAPCPVLVVKN
ncbi:MAG: hypothetical protein A2V65_09305 [Deltaproteobacteria bacterium RBG_13_49_15]|nr:MAG: hypothetical protein A2V65_09305 [Deltaproteobacteria bacterium RBG_13_49_15]